MFSADAVDWIEGPVVTQARAGAWTAHQVSLRDHGELNDVEVVWVRIAPEFESTATGSGADEYRAVGETSNYSTAGSWWMDSVTITGWEVGTSNTLPTISAVSDLELMEGETSGAMEFQIFDAETAAENLAVEASVAGAGVITNLVLGGSDVARTVRFRAEEAGEAFVTLRVTDEEGGFAEATFKVTVMASPVEPTLGRNRRAERMRMR
jgi:hypothetical protein